MTVQEDAAAQDGKKYVRFENRIPGRGSRMLQGLALDGREVHALELSLSIRGSAIAPGQTRDQLPVASLVFYDQNRAIIGRDLIGPWRGSFGWRRESGPIRVPPQTREAIVHLGLFGGTGVLDIDRIELRPLDGKEPQGSTDVQLPNR